MSDLCAVAHTLLSLHDNTPQKKRSGSHDPTECPHGLGGFSAWPAQAWAFPDRQAPQEGAITNQLLPTECPHGSCDLFRLGSPNQGILGRQRTGVKSTVQNRSTRVQPNAHMARATFSAWGRRGKAFSNKDGLIAIEAGEKLASVQPNAHMARATFSAWGCRARAFFLLIRANRASRGRRGLAVVGARRMPQWSGWILRL